MTSPRSRRRAGALTALLYVTVLGGCSSPDPGKLAPTPGTTLAPRGPTSRPTGSSSVSGQPTATDAGRASGSARPTVPGSGTPTGKPTATGCGALAAELSLRERVGQLLMVGTSSAGPSSRDAQVIANSRAGSVLLLGNSVAGLAATKKVTARVRAVDRPPNRVDLLIAADQEGGLVQRLKGPGFTTIPTARIQATMSNSDLAADARTWGRQLSAAGIDADLAPVADVVPTNLVSVNQPIGQLRRGYGTDPEVVAAKVRAFVDGMRAAGIATSVKHFPGLGRVRGNTDYVSDVVDPTTTRHDPAMVGFAGAVKEGVDMVMVSSAIYRKIDPDRRAAFSPTVIGQMIRGDLGFDGVVISDDLAAVAMNDLAPATRVIRFVSAGGDLAILGNPAMAQAAADGLVRRAQQDPGFAKQVEAAATRVLEMKARHDLTHC